MNDGGFLLDNTHKQDPKRFGELDPHLSKLRQLNYAYKPALLQQLPTTETGIYTLTGGCLTGKTTLLKLWIEKLLTDGIPAEAITFFSGELIKDDEELSQLLHLQLDNKSPELTQFILIDNVTYIRNWDKAIQFAVDTYLLDHAIILLTSSNQTIRKKIPSSLAKFQLYPLTFREAVLLKQPQATLTETDLFKEFNDYLQHGGYLIAINDMAQHQQILDETLKIYTDALRKEILHNGRQEHFLREILTAIIDHYCRPITWNMLAQELSINHPKTVGDYVTLLDSLDVVFIQSALLERHLSGAPKKARKLIFTDPFIFHAIRAWLQQPNKDFFAGEIKSSVERPDLSFKLAQAYAISYYRRFYPTYYIKSEGEIDLAYIYDQRFWPVTITWSDQLRTKDLKQLLKYPNSKLLTKALRSGIIEHVRTEPLAQALWKLEEKQRLLLT